MDAVHGAAGEGAVLRPYSDPALEREIRSALGVSLPSVPYLVRCPWLARSAVILNLRDQQLAYIGFDLLELVFLAVSQDNSCRYCYQSQRALLRLQGLDDDRIARLEQASHIAEGDPTDRSALAFARRISRANPLPDASDWQALREAGFGDGAIREIALVAATTLATNRITTLAGVPPDSTEQQLGRWYVRLLRPVLARQTLSKQRTGRPRELAPEERTGPFSTVVNRLDGLPAAPAMRRLIDEAWGSRILRPRTKALIVAVIAHGLGCKTLEEEALSLVEAAGLPSRSAREVVEHLGGPELDPLEAMMVPFARETIRYRPEDIQQQARALAAQLPVDQYLESIGIAALANTLSRLCLVLEAQPLEAA